MQMIQPAPVRCWKEVTVMKLVYFGGDFSFAPARTGAHEVSLIEGSSVVSRSVV